MSGSNPGLPLDGEEDPPPHDPLDEEDPAGAPGEDDLGGDEGPSTPAAVVAQDAQPKVLPPLGNPGPASKAPPAPATPVAPKRSEASPVAPSVARPLGDLAQLAERLDKIEELVRKGAPELSGGPEARGLYGNNPSAFLREGILELISVVRKEMVGMADQNRQSHGDILHQMDDVLKKQDKIVGLFAELVTKQMALMESMSSLQLAYGESQNNTKTQLQLQNTKVQRCVDHMETTSRGVSKFGHDALSLISAIQTVAAAIAGSKKSHVFLRYAAAGAAFGGGAIFALVCRSCFFGEPG